SGRVPGAIYGDVVVSVPDRVALLIVLGDLSFIGLQNYQSPRTTPDKDSTKGAGRISSRIW
ncbi:hypothetical protein J6590_020997, partial [Homalodisca vitripennis]